MKKTTKLMTVLLAVAMTAQIAPVSALGDDAADEYVVDVQNESVDVSEDSEDILPEDAPEDVTASEPETDAPAEPDTDAETEAVSEPISITAMQWQDYSTGSRFYTLKDGTSINRNYIRVRLLLSAAPTAVEVAINGTPVEAELDRNVVLVTAELVNSTHEMTVTMYNGDTATQESFGFTVAGSQNYPALNVTPSADLVIGQTREFLVTGSNLADVSKLSASITVTRGLRVEEVIIPDGLVGSYIWLRGELKLNLEITDPSAIQNGVLASVYVHVPETVSPDAELVWAVENASFELVDDPAFSYGEHFSSTFLPSDMTAVSEETFSIVGSGAPTLGMPYTVIVKDRAGSPIAGALVYASSDEFPEFLGVTNEQGMLTTDFFTARGAYELFAVNGNASTSTTNLTVRVYEYVGNEDGSPYAIRFGTPAANKKTITWMSHYLNSTHSAQIRVSASPDMSNSVTLSGSSSLGQYGDDGLIINRYNSVTLNNLVSGTVYYYQVGDGLVWSEVRAFTAGKADDSVNIAVFGDIHDSANMGLVADAIRDGGVAYDFGILTGSLVTNDAQYNEIADRVNAVSKLPAMDMIYVSNDAEKKSTTANTLFNTGKEYETFVYGNVFVAVIHVTEDRNTLEANLTKMLKDAQDSNTEWQILCLRQSPYSTDPANAASLVAELVPQKAEWAGIDLVLSSSDLHYARTEEMKSDAFTEKNGVTYIICGSSDDKTPISNTDGYLVTSDTYNALYISIETQGVEMKVTAYNVKADGSVEVVDEYVRSHFVCREDEHVYRYGVSDKYIYCDHCGVKTTIGQDFRGVLLLEGFYMYFEDGAFSTGWKHNGRDVYYFSPNYFMGLTGTQLIDGYVYTFENYVLVEGAWFEEDGVTKLMWAGEMLTNTWHTQCGKTYYFYEDGSYATGTVEITYIDENGATVTGTYIFGDDGVLIEQIA